MSAFDEPNNEEEMPLTSSKQDQAQKNPSDDNPILKKCRSDYMPLIDRETLAEEKGLYFTPTVAGLLGLSLPYVDKASVYKIKSNLPNSPMGVDIASQEQEEKELSHKRLRASKHFLRMYDGLFVQLSEIGTEAVNLRRLEETLILDEKFHYFDEEGELILDREFMDEKMQRIFTIDQEENPALSTMQRSATLCSRVNQNKNKPFKLEIMIGTLQFTYHPDFNREDTLIMELRYLMKKYRLRADLALLPLYKKTKDILQKELSELNNEDKERAMIQMELDKIEKQFVVERQLMQNIMNQIYSKWEAIKVERKTHDYVGSPFKLTVRQYLSNENTNEIEFLLQDQEINEDQLGRGQPITRVELNRRQKIRNFPVQLIFLINNKVVARSKKVNLSWPRFQCEFKERFQVYVFTKPSTLKLQILHATLVPKVIDTIEIEIPGEKSHTITSAGYVLKEAYFNQGREDVRKNRYNNLVLNPGGDDTIYRDKGPAYEGFISYRTEWARYGPMMPPDSLDLDMQYADAYQKFEDEEEEIINSDKYNQERDERYFDVNDPRNQDLISKLVTGRKQAQEDHSESMVPNGKVKSFRQILLKKRFIQPELREFQIPMLQDRIRFDPALVEFITSENDEEKNWELELNRQQKQSGPQILQDFINNPATQKRLRNIQSTLQTRKIEAKVKKSGSSGGLLNLENVVGEFHFEAAASLLAECCKQIFTKRRKLGPQKKSALDRKNVQTIPEVQISVLIVQANNVPIRSESLKELRRLQAQMGGKSTSKQYGNNEIKEIIDKLYQMKKVSPAISLELSLFSKNIFVIQYQEAQIKNPEKNQQTTNLLSRTNKMTNQNQAFLPQRQEEEEKKDIDDDLITIQDRVVVGSNQIEMTSEVEGINPEWNELIDFRIGRPKKEQTFDAADIINSRNKIVITLYDQMGSGRQNPTNVDRWTLSVKRHFIGQITIPLLTLFQQEKLSGTFRIQRPLMMINYQTLKVDQFLSQSENNPNSQTALHNRHNIIDPHIPTTLDLTMTLDPPIKVNEQFASTDYFPGAELTNFFLYGVRHLQNLQRNPKLKGRNIKFWAENLKGESVFLPRYLAQLVPPQMDFGVNAIEKAARFVSLIPFKNDTEHFQDLPDIYCDCQEFIDLRAGDFEEHAILLCCYFMYIDQNLYKRDDIKSYVVMGKGLPEGNTQYVMRRLVGSNFVEIWNPQTGEPFVFQNEEFVTKLLGILPVNKGFRNVNDIDDQACPLNSIGCVFDDQNVYVNIQPSDNPAEISFDIDNPKLWEPFLHADQVKSFFPNGIQSVQKDLQYDQIDEVRAQLIQDQLQQYLQDRITQTRLDNIPRNKNSFSTTFVTQKNAELTSAISDMLFNLECFKFRIRVTGLAKAAGDKDLEKNEKGANNFMGNDAVNQKAWDYDKSLEFLSTEHQKILKAKNKQREEKEIYGFPLNFTYIDNEKAWDEVRATGIQDILSDDLEYILKVRCFPYPHYIISCWVFVAVLHDPSQLM